MKTLRLAVLGLGQRGIIYSDYATKHSSQFALTAVIDNDPVKAQYAKKHYSGVLFYSDYRDFIAARVAADLVAICTQDRQHKEHALALMRAGYDLLLEKPVAVSAEDCLEILRVSRELGRRVIVCHVLRYSRFYAEIKRQIDGDVLGKIESINTTENVGYFHYAHSYIRGPWRNSETSSPMILAKCCHDMDLLRYLIGKKCLSISSFGELSVFKPENAPVGAVDYCTDCSVEGCPYRANEIYLKERFFARYFTLDENDTQMMIADLKHSPYDRCVWHSDNDVVDHQVVIARFEEGATASHTMCAFSKEIYRDIKIYGTKAQLFGRMESNEFEIHPFNGETQKIKVDVSAADVGAHNGSDYYMMNDLFRFLNGESVPTITDLSVSIGSHMMCFAAEASRLNGGAPVSVEM